MDRAENKIPKDGEVDLLIKSWGWEFPSDEIIELANISLQYQSMRSGAILTELNLLTTDQLKKLLTDKPNSVRLLEFAAQQDPKIRPTIDRILALKQSYAYYDTLSGLTMHHCMTTKVIHARCEDLDAVVMEIEDSTPIVIFSSYSSMMEYTTAGREIKQNDIIRRQAKTLDAKDILVAVGKRDAVIQMLSVSKVSEGNEVRESTEAFWHASTATDKYQKTLVRMIDYCIEKKVTDISIVPLRTGGTANFMRRFGDLVDMPKTSLTDEEYKVIVNFLMAKSGANPKGVSVFVPTDGQITYRSGAGDVFLRLSFIPLNHPGDDSADMTSISIRILPRTETVINLEDLKIATNVISQIKTYATYSQGLILLAGGTNTGKSTTIAGAIGENVKHFGSKRKRISIEQPIERFLPGVLQINIPERVMKDGNAVEGFGLMLRAIKRHDPDVIWVGEIRDEESANVCVASAISGHLVFSTIHANHTLLGYDNLSKMVHPDKRFQLIESLKLIIAQRLVKEVCSHCRIIEAPTESESSRFKTFLTETGNLHIAIPTEVAHAHPKGCSHCQKTGYMGSLPVNEVLPVTYEVKDAMLDMLNNVNRKKVIEDARTLKMIDSAMDLIMAFRIELGSAII